MRPTQHGWSTIIREIPDNDYFTYIDIYRYIPQKSNLTQNK